MEARRQGEPMLDAKWRKPATAVVDRVRRHPLRHHEDSSVGDVVSACAFHQFGEVGLVVDDDAFNDPRAAAAR